MAAVGDDTIKDKLLKGDQVGDMTYKVHLDDYSFLPYLEGKENGPRDTFFAFFDDGSLGALRYKDWKFHFSTQDHDDIGSWFFARQTRKAPLFTNLRADPFEVAPEDSSYYDDWLVRHMYAMVPVKDLAGKFMATFKDFPPRQEGGSFTPAD